MKKIIIVFISIAAIGAIMFIALFLKMNFLAESALPCSFPNWKNCLINLKAGGSAVGMSNPASANCLDKGGKLIMKKSENGGEFGVCRLANGGECEEWAYFRGECTSGDSIAYEKNSREMAFEWIKNNAPTYRLDGFNLQYAGTETLSCAYCYEFKFKFTSKNSGYGERQGMKLDQSITFHEVAVVVEKGVVKAVVTDGKFDELAGIHK